MRCVPSEAQPISEPPSAAAESRLRVPASMWLPEEIFHWTPESGSGGNLGEPSRIVRAYEILAHARQLVYSAESKFLLADALSNLKRSVNARLQHIEELYKFSDLFSKGIGALERLEQVGLVKPFLIKKLFELRNNVEHNDSDPPDAARLHELADVTWYFLKATDPVCKVVPHGIVFTCDIGPLARSPQLFFTTWLVPGNNSHVEIAGWFTTGLMYEANGHGRLEVRINVCRERPAAPISDDPINQHAYMLNRQRGADERWLEGSVSVSKQLLHRLWKISLEVN